MNQKPNIVIRWRWLFTVAAILEILNTAEHFAKHDISAWPIASYSVIPMLAFGAAGMSVLAIAAWWGYFWLQRQRRTP